MHESTAQEEEPHAIIFDQFQVKRGESWFVLGGPNSGKTSFLMAILKQMVIDLKPRPLFKIRGKFHLIDRESFILNGSVLENISLSQELNFSKLNNVLKMVNLESLLDASGVAS